jgi:hypothetical protein
LENRFAPVAAIHHVINRAGIFNSKFPRHAPKSSPATQH